MTNISLILIGQPKGSIMPIDQLNKIIYLYGKEKASKMLLKTGWEEDYNIHDKWIRVKTKCNYSTPVKPKINHYNIKPKTNTNYIIKKNLRNYINKAVRNYETYKNKKLLELLGCSFLEFRQHLESTFQSGMTWDNYGKWEIDHIIPCAAFDLTDSEQQKICFNYKNMQALWKMDNINKRDLLPNNVGAKEVCK